MGGFVYKFGSNNHIIYAMSDSMILVVSSTLVLNYLLDKRLNTKILTTSSGLILSIFIYCIIDNGYKNPYRLITDIKGQDQYVYFLGGLSVELGCIFSTKDR